ncbi:cation:proton antiporter [Cryptosporangium aurantiacum]|uniref:Sodium/proton antiporter, CPA1 family n=1 Tax=Cryptosporangium aurantiacum TaxID=134849 RepID=A0A1M7TUU6_9ACTN|nr:sodium:proton antiporter [Cryptosporangium aurantiacum]SHN74491.1 sodium/proton antiporter, CPA1 family [Cryptosporangium aurantiacum]
MNAGILLVLLALGAIAISEFGRRINAQPGLLILVAAAAVSFLPGLPRLELHPELILGLVVPPLLYAAALEFSFFSFVRNLRSIIGLGVWLVLLTALAVGYTTAWLLPAVGVSVAFVLASIVAPPDTVTITSHGDEIGLPRRVSAILTGESLVNDAAALTLFTITVGWTSGEASFIDQPVLLFLYSAAAGILIGTLLGNLATLLRHYLDPTLATAVGLILPFGAYLAAEEVHASGVLAVVMAGFSVSVDSAFGNRRRQRLDYRTRMTEREVWPVLGSLLEAFVFAYTGLQLRFVIEELRESGEPFGRAVLAGVVLLLVVIAVRYLWVSVVFGRRLLAMQAFYRRLEDPRWRELMVRRRQRALERLQRRQRRRGRPGRLRGQGPSARPRGPMRSRRLPAVLSWGEQALVSWTGMRGIVTLGAAGGIPLVTEAGEPFPHRTLLQFLAYVVVIGTLLIQGPTLPLLARWLRIDTTEEDREAADALARATAVAALAAGSGNDEGTDAYFDRQRDALALAVVQRDLDDEAAQIVLERIDRRQAAAEPVTGSVR